MVTKLGGGEVIVKQANSSPVQNSENILQNPTLESDFSALKEEFCIDEVGTIRLSKLVPEHTDNEEIFGEEFKRKIDFYKNFLGVDIRVNITENELFAGYKKVSIDIDGKHNTQVWNHIMKNIVPTFEKDGFEKTFISLEVLKDLPKEILDDYMKLVSADFVLENGNIIKDIVLWFENALATKYSKEKGLGYISETIRGNSDLEHLMMMIAHVSKMDKDFQETLELLYIKLVRYKDPKVQGLLRFLGHNVDKNVSEKKLIDKVRSKFSISVAKILGGFGGAKEEKPKKKIPVLSFRSAQKLTPQDGGKKDSISPESFVSPEQNLSNQLALGDITIEEYNREKKKLLPGGKISLIFDMSKNIDKLFKAGDKLTDKEVKKLNTLFGIDGIRLLNYGDAHYLDASYYYFLEEQYKTLMKSDSGFSEKFWNFIDEVKNIFFISGLAKDLNILSIFVEKNNLPQNPAMFPHFWELLKNYLDKNVTFVKGLKDLLGTDVIFKGRKNANYCPNLEWKGEIRLSSGGGDSTLLVNLDKKDSESGGEIEDQLLPFARAVAEIFGLNDFNGIESLEEAFLNRKTFDIKSVFPQNISAFISGKIFFDKEGFLHIDGNLNLQTIIENSDFGMLIRGLLNGNFEVGNVIIENEKLTFVEFSDFVKEMQVNLTHYLEKDTKNGIAQLLHDNIEIFKNDENKRKKLLQIITSKKQEFNPDLIEFYRELGKIDKEFRKLYTLSSISKVEKVQVLKTLIERNNLSIVDVWLYLSESLKLKFFASFEELFDYEIEEKRFNELLVGAQKELKYLLGDDISDIERVFDDLFGDDNYLALDEEIRDISEENIIKKDVKAFFIVCAEKRKKEIEDAKEKIEKRKKEITEFIQKSTKEKNQIVGLVFDYNFDEKGYVTGNITFKVETFSYLGNRLPRLKFILEGGLSNKLYFQEVDLEGLQESIENWEAYNSFKNYELSEEDFIKYFDSKSDKELQPYISDVKRFLNGNDRNYIFKDKEFGRKFLERCYSLDEKFLPELIIFVLSEAQTFEDLLKIKRTIGDFDRNKWISFVSNKLNKIIEDDLLDALKKLDFVRLEHYLQLDDEGEGFLQELQKQDFNNSNGLLKFTQKYRGKGIIISKICTLIDNYIVVKPKTKKHLYDTYLEDLLKRHSQKENIQPDEKSLNNIIFNKEIINNIINKKYK